MKVKQVAFLYLLEQKQSKVVSGTSLQLIQRMQVHNSHNILIADRK